MPASVPLSRHAAPAFSRQQLLILAGLFTMSLGSYLVLPFLAIALRERDGLSNAAVGIALTANLWGQRGLMLPAGWCTDRFGPRAAVVTGLLIRSVSYAGIAFAHQPAVLVASCAAMGAASALYIPASKTALTSGAADPRHIRKILSTRSAVNNVGTAIGPLLGTALQQFGIVTCLLSAAALYLLLVPVFAVYAPRAVVPGQSPLSPALGRPEQKTRSGARAICWLFIFTVGFGILYSQLQYGLPVYAQARSGTIGPGLVFAVNAVVVVAVQLLLADRLSQMGTSDSLALGFLPLAAGLAIAPAGLAWTLFAGVALFSVGEAVLDPRLDSEAATRVSISRQGTAYGMLGVALAIGGTLGNFAPAATRYLSYPNALRLIGAVIIVVTVVLWLRARTRKRRPHLPTAFTRPSRATPDRQLRDEQPMPKTPAP